jgi:hypothetical protein
MAVVKFGDLVPGKTIQEKVDPVTGKSSRTVIESKTGEERPRISIKAMTARPPSFRREGMARYILPVEAIILMEEGDPVKAGDIHCQTAPRDHQNQGYHRRSAPGRRTVRGQKTQRSGRIE